MRKITLPLFGLAALLLALAGCLAPWRAVFAQVEPHSAATWVQLSLPSTGEEENEVIDAAVHPTDARTLLAATAHGLYRSFDAGDTWALLLDAHVRRVAFTPAASNRIYASGYSPSTGDRVLFRSDDSGATWQEFALPAPLCTLVTAPSTADRLYASPCTGAETDTQLLYTTADGGAAWTQSALPGATSLLALAVAPDDPLRLLMADAEALYRSADGGQNWQQALQKGNLHTLAFDPAVVNQVYAAGGPGVLRSSDGGATWQIATTYASLRTMVLWPNRSAMVALQWQSSGNSDGSGAFVGALWEFSGTSWQRSAMSLPATTQWLYAGRQSDAAFYARDEAKQLWRYALEPVTYDYSTFLPTVIGAAGAAGDADGAVTAAAADTPGEVALARTNEYRSGLGIYPMALDANIQRAAENTVLYYTLNQGDESAWANGPHGEVPDKPGFTGKTPTDRCNAAGFAGGCGEVRHYLGNPAKSIDGWIDTVYHRLALINPFMAVGGYAMSSEAGKQVDVLNMSSSNRVGGWIAAGPTLWVYPYDGQQEVPPMWGGGECPNPLPPDAQRPVGYPITVQSLQGSFSISEASLVDDTGAVVAVHPNPADCASFGCYALIPVAPLRPNTTYTVTVRGTLADAPVEKQWRFTTGAQEDVYMAGDGIIIGPPAPEP